jgi:rhodanese-related sulfurtransferase
MATLQERTTSKAPGHVPSQSVYETSPAELMELLAGSQDHVFVVDIQDPDVFEGGHIPGARNIHLEDLVASCSDLPKERTIVIYCGDVSCGLPLWAALELAQMGFCVKYLHGGFEEWKRNELPIEISPPAPAPEY